MAVDRRWTLRTEAQWRNRVVRGWYPTSEAPHATQWHDTRWHQPVECASPTGWPDVCWAKPEQGSGWIEMKLVRGTNGHRVSLGLSSAQPLVLRWMRSQGMHAGILAWVVARAQWLWVPAQAAHRWALNVQGPNGFLLWPHTWGIGEVPRPWLLPMDKRLLPWPMHKRNPLIRHMVDGVEVTPQAFDAASTFPMDYKAIRKQDAVLESVVTTLRKSVSMKRTMDAKRAAQG